jgi:hypothetical protein
LAREAGLVSPEHDSLTVKVVRHKQPAVRVRAVNEGPVSVARYHLVRTFWIEFTWLWSLALGAKAMCFSQPEPDNVAMVRSAHLVHH